MRKTKAVILGLAFSLFSLLASAGYAQQDPSDSGARDTIYIKCTPPDFFDKDSIMVSFDFMFWTDATFPNEYIVNWTTAFFITSSNPGASARVIVDEKADGPVFKGTAVGYPNDWEARFNGTYPLGETLPKVVVYGAIQDLLPPANVGPSLSAGTHILAHIPIIVKDTTTICIDTETTEIPEGNFFIRNDIMMYRPFWIKKTCCPVTPLTCLYKPGDANGNGKVDLADLIFMVNYIMKGGPAPVFECQVDLNADGIVTLLDIVVAVNYLFKGGNPPLKSWACCL
ncbi:MAG: hypothetical protein RBG1_1C00001G0576 [candidate division Zixibacteria bacterium RBG-1]|nr:MAG: hypothetical protein RBG1_1C00001G0576 [candidate division Zixibacteria bacterium RBG-1]